MDIESLIYEIDKLRFRCSALAKQIDFIEDQLEITRRDAESPNTSKRGEPAGDATSKPVRATDDHDQG